MARLADKHVLVTAAAQGIGRAVVEAAAAEGAFVIATDPEASLLIELEAIENVTARRLDPTDAEAVARTARDVGALDGLAVVTGGAAPGTVLDADDAALAAAWREDVQATHRLIRALLPAMLAHRGGSIVTVASVVSSLKGAPRRFLEGTTRAALIGLTKSVAADFVDRDVRCNAVCPGAVATAALEHHLDEAADPDAARRAATAGQPTGRLGTAAEVAAAVVHLLADESAYVTGTTHVVDGGWSL